MRRLYPHANLTNSSGSFPLTVANFLIVPSATRPFEKSTHSDGVSLALDVMEFLNDNNISVFIDEWHNLSDHDFDAFAKCKALSGNINFPDFLQRIGDNAFSDCDKITTVTLSQKTKISYNSFAPEVKIIRI
jgi:hypothetical protein